MNSALLALRNELECSEIVEFLLYVVSIEYFGHTNAKIINTQSWFQKSVIIALTKSVWFLDL